MSPKQAVACGVMFDPHGNILMGRRSSKSSGTGIWEFPGGKKEAGESITECLKREWKEELNLDITIFKCIYSSMNESEACYFFVGKIDCLSTLKINVHEHIGFFPLDEICNLRKYDGDEKIVDILLKYLQTTSNNLHFNNSPEGIN